MSSTLDFSNTGLRRMDGVPFMRFLHDVSFEQPNLGGRSSYDVESTSFILAGHMIYELRSLEENGAQRVTSIIMSCAISE